MELTNEQRKYLGLELIDPAWDRVEISIHYSGSYEEDSVYLKTLENRTLIASKTGKGKPKRLNAVNLQRFSANE